MSGGSKRNADKLNTVGIVVIGLCGSVLVYVSIVLLQAFYVKDSSTVQMMADYGGQDTDFQRGRADEVGRISQCSNVMGAAGTSDSTHTIRIEDAMRLVVDGARKDPAALVPVFGRADQPTIQAKFGRPVALPPPPPDGAAPAPDGAAPAPDGAAPAPDGAAPAAAPGAAAAPDAAAPAAPAPGAR